MKTTLALGTALAWIALCFFVQSSLGQEAVIPPVVETDNDDVDGDDNDETENKSRRRRSHRKTSAVNADSGVLTNPNEGLSLALTSATEPAEVEGVVVTGTWYDTYPVP